MRLAWCLLAGMCLCFPRATVGQDPDFASNGGQGWFLTLQVRLTENNPIVDYWRNRMRSTMDRRGER